MTKKTNGLINLLKEIPAAFIAADSYLSDKLPNAIIDESNTPIGNAVGEACMQV